MLIYRNLHIHFTDNNTFVVKADVVNDDRFEDQSIVYESYSLEQCRKWMYQNYRNWDGTLITTGKYWKTDSLWRSAMSTCNIPDNPHYVKGETICRT